VAAAKKDKAVYINFLTRISKDCDCMPGYEKIVPDIGVLLALDPVALDAASSTWWKARRPAAHCPRLRHPHRIQIEYAREIDCNPDYQLGRAVIFPGEELKNIQYAIVV
jgi:uncharacterized Fe-S center protein